MTLAALALALAFAALPLAVGSATASGPRRQLGSLVAIAMASAAIILLGMVP